MKKFIRFITALTVCITAMAVTGCEGKTGEDNSDKIIVATTEAQETTAEITAEAVTELPSETVSTEPITETGTDITSESHNDEYKTVLNAYHQAYINADTNAVYALFCPDEITAFDTYMKNYLKTENGEDDKTLNQIFTKESVMSAIDASVKNIHSIMDGYNESENDTWSVNIDETTVEHYSENELAEINSQLGINITDGYICEIPFYKNDTNEEVFVAEPASVLLIDGKWYISYSAAFDRLIDFMEIDF
ncbi:MAG: hypothetical protein K2O29_09650 [Ruminococcus sp.]|nr:hypothetical protein [Ruminococcus sp.]